MNDSSSYEAPLAIHCVWNAKDDLIVMPIVERLVSLLTRDDLSSFARNLTIPIFNYRSKTVNDVPSCIRSINAKTNLCFFFSSLYTAGQDNWIKYKKDIAKKNNQKIIGVALSKDGLSLFCEDNAIRYYDGDCDTRAERCIISIMHEILRWGLIGVKKSMASTDSSLKLFLSHTKADDGLGEKWAMALRNCISKTNMSSFFDATDIGPGYDFGKEIKNPLSKSNCALVAICTDEYAIRYWCQKEVLTAKENNLPIIVLDLIDKKVDRSFPALTNTPVFRYGDISDKNLLSILLATVYEVVRSRFVQQLLNEYKTQCWIPKRTTILNRPPEVFMPSSVHIKRGAKICYPEPPVYSEELHWIEKLGIIVFTPLQYEGKIKMKNNLAGKKIGISISDVYPEEFNRNCHPALLKVFSQDMARHILIQGGGLIYGGDLRADGFTRFLASAVASLEDSGCNHEPLIENHLAWPIYVDNEETMHLIADYGKHIKVFETAPPEDIKDKIDIKNKHLPNTPENGYILSRCLTAMREKSISRSFARICAGGKLSGYKGKMPGVLEEIEIAINSSGMPLYLCGGFGGCVGEVCATLTTRKLSTALTEEWQTEQNGGYKSLQEVTKINGYEVNYKQIAHRLCSEGCLTNLIDRSGLSRADYERLMKSPFVDECIHLIMKGLCKVVC